MSTKRNGLLALLGLGALAWWKYQNSTPEEQQAVKDKINTAKDNFNKWGNDLKNKASEVAQQVQQKVDQTKTSVEDSVNQS
ncbi:YtxH domain-containing protein [Chryseobacterium koreense]|uniref:YtxH domain-containing protein n=1 Tax=Chryseobacterium koreense TaxID=232216 RepID=UPI0026F2CD09|nr:YtxH domain-containing protein [Chryseobacterium koreense]